MKVLVSIHIPEVGIEMLKSHPGIDLTVWDVEDKMDRATLLKKAPLYDIVLSSSEYRIDKEFIEACPRLKMLSQFSVGYDNVDIHELEKRKIPFGNAPGAMTDATADTAFMLMLAVSRKMVYMTNRIKEGTWGFTPPRAFLGLELKHKTLGVFGLGTIGTEMARRCKGAYNMDIIYHNRTKNPIAENELGAQYVSFNELLEKSDVVSVHCALTPETKGIFNKKAFSKMKPTSIFLNTARGPIHNEIDLIQALKKGEIWGAGLDVTNPEPMIKDNPLLFMENVCITPHIGSATYKARDEMARMAATNIIQFVDGKKITNLVNVR